MYLSTSENTQGKQLGCIGWLTIRRLALSIVQHSDGNLNWIYQEETSIKWHLRLKLVFYANAILPNIEKLLGIFCTSMLLLGRSRQTIDSSNKLDLLE